MEAPVFVCTNLYVIWFYKENTFLTYGILGIISAKNTHHTILTKKTESTASDVNNVAAILLEMPVYNSNI